MILNRLEFVLMNNAIRAMVQRRFEATRLLNLGGRMDGGCALEIGCGRGVGIEIILRTFHAAIVHGIDVDARMIKLARRRLRRCGTAVQVWVGSATEIAAADDTYDAVFDFGILHHIVDWRGALHEIRRVLKPGGRLYAEEILAACLNGPFIRTLLDHPRSDRFDAAEFQTGLHNAGLLPVAVHDRHPGVAWFIAKKPPSA